MKVDVEARRDHLGRIVRPTRPDQLLKTPVTDKVVFVDYLSLFFLSFGFFGQNAVSSQFAHARSVTALPSGYGSVKGSSCLSLVRCPSESMYWMTVFALPHWQCGS